MTDRTFTLAEGMAVLERTPRVLDALLRDLPEPWTQADEGPGTWSPYEVLGHLVHGERTDWIPRARIILSRGPDLRFAPFDRFAQQRATPGASLNALLDAFATIRQESLAELRGWRLGDAELALTGIHPEFGPVTLRQLLATWVAHDLGHLVQVSRVMARRYEGAVGPWSKYLSVMSGQGRAGHSRDLGDASHVAHAE